MATNGPLIIEVGTPRSGSVIQNYRSADRDPEENIYTSATLHFSFIVWYGTHQYKRLHVKFFTGRHSLVKINS
jgi:hypothetical protein